MLKYARFLDENLKNLETAMEHFSWKTPLIDTTPQLAQRLTNLDLNFHAIETRRMVFGDFSMCSKGSSNTKKIGSRGAPSEKFFTNSLV